MLKSIVYNIKMIRLVIILFCFFQTSLFSGTITLLSPPDNTITSKSLIQIKGVAEDISKIQINGASLPVNNNRFNGRFVLKEDNAYTVFHIIGTTNKQEKIEKKIKVFKKYSPSNKNKINSEMSVLPKNKAIVKYEKILLEGSSRNIERIIINNIDVPIKKNGSFKHIITLKKKDDYNDFFIIGFGKDKTIHTQTYSYFLKEKKNPSKILIGNASPKINTKNIITSMMTSIKKEYAHFGWKERPASLQLPSSLPKQLLKKYNDYFLYLEHQEEILIALPFFTINQPITDISMTILNEIKNQKSQKKLLKILWYNSNNSYWEMYFTLSKGAIIPSLWLLNDQEINPFNLSKENKHKINTFLSNPFS